MSIIQEYAPTDNCSDEFHDDLDKLIRTIPRKDVLVVLGDFNAKIG